MADPDIVKEYPIKDGLQKFHNVFKSACRELGVSASADSVQRMFQDRTDDYDLIHTLLSDLRTVRAARQLRSNIGSESIRDDIKKLMNEFEGNHEWFIPLVQTTVEEPPDAEIWNAVYELVTKSQPKESQNSTFDKSGLSEGSVVLYALHEDWNSIYFPHSRMVLQDLIQRYQLYEVDQYYAKTIVFVQSSGMGKSRLADAFGETCPMINFVLREHGTKGFPGDDEEILEFLRRKRPDNITDLVKKLGSLDKSDDSPETRAGVAWNHTIAVALLQASCERFTEWVNKNRDDKMTLKQLAGRRHKEMAPLAPDANAQDAKSQRSKERVEFCQAVATRAQAIANKLASNLSWVQTFVRNKASQIRRQLMKSGPMNDLLTTAIQLTRTLRQFAGARDVDSLLVFVFDEASSLMREKAGDKEVHPQLYVALNRVISGLKTLRVWTFFLSTESQIGHLIPPNNSTKSDDDLPDTSRRWVGQNDKTELKRFPPFVAFQLDIEDRRKMGDPVGRKEELQKPLEKFATLEHMALFGRPLWYAYKDQTDEMIQLAKIKLIGDAKSGKYNPTDENHVFAALSFRLCLDVCLQNPTTIDLSRKAVDSFMRVVISMDHETGVIDTIAPSEPVLARAAMEHLCSREFRDEDNTKIEDNIEFEDDIETGDNTKIEDNTEIEGKTEYWSLSIRTLTKELLEKRLVEKGRKGELYARLVLTLAHDWVRCVSNKTFTPTFSVSDFLMALYAEDHHNSIQNIPERILDARMNFTHFLSTDENLTAEVIPDLCHDLLRRSAAMQLSWQQATYDLLIPVYYGSEDEEFDPSACGVVVIQVKNKTAATTPQEIFQEDFNIISNASKPATSEAIQATSKVTLATSKVTPATSKVTQAPSKATPTTTRVTRATSKATPATSKVTQAPSKAIPTTSKVTRATSKATPATSGATQATSTASTQRVPEKFVFNQTANPILFLLFDLGVNKTKKASSPLVQVSQSNSSLQPDLWAIHSRGHDETVFGCLRHMNVIESSKRFFIAVQSPKTPADQLCQRNKPFHRLQRSFRYEKLAQGDTGEGGEGSGRTNTRSLKRKRQQG